MQKLATKTFIYSSLLFGTIGILVILTSPNGNAHGSDINESLIKALFLCVFVILPSFALSIAGKYLDGK